MSGRANCVWPALALTLAACAGDGIVAPHPVCDDAAAQRAAAASLTLGVGEVLELCDPGAMAEVRLPGGATVRDYLVVVLNSSSTADQLASFRLQWSHGAAASAGVGGTLAEAAPFTVTEIGQGSFTRSAHGATVESEIRAYEQTIPGPAQAARLWSSVRDRALAREGRRSVAAALPAVGDARQIRVPHARSGNLCYSYTAVTARVRAIGERVIVLEDESAPANGFTSDDLAALVGEVDELHAAVASRYFGELSDIDGNGRVLLLITPEVNRLSQAGSGSYVSGYFFGGDLLPRYDGALWPVCLQSNEAEIIYALAPDPWGSITGERRTPADVRQQLRGTIIHELQHMINHGVRSRTGAESESVWLNEALSHLAEELAGRVRRDLGDFEELTTEDLIDVISGVRDYDAYFLQNLLRFRAFLSRPDTTSPTSAASRTHLAPRGAAWALLRYAADHHAAEDLPGFLRAIVAGPGKGADNLAAVAAVPFDSLLAGWMVANFADGLSLPLLQPRHTYRSWRMRPAVTDAAGSQSGTTAGYPLRITRLTEGGDVESSTPRSGSGVYYVLTDRSALGGGLVSLLSAQGAPVSHPGARLLLLRIR